MEWSPVIPDSSTDEGKITLRRLLVAKQFYLHGQDHANRSTGIDKMIAVHNFHNSIEIVLRCILLHYGFIVNKDSIPEMIKEIESKFKDKGVIFPLANKVSELNKKRNLVQHDAYEPEETMMAEWHVFTRNFLQDAYQSYFGLDFEYISRLDLISVPTYRESLALSLLNINNGLYEKSLVLLAKIMDTVNFQFFPDDKNLQNFVRGSFITPNITDLNEIEEILFQLAYYVDKNFFELELLSRGIDLHNYRKFMQISPVIVYDQAEKKNAAVFSKKPDESTAKWANDFIIEMLIQLQSLEDISIHHETIENYYKSLLDTNCKDIVIKFKSE